MNCEICKKNPAETAIDKDGEELYVCKACANAERLKNQKKSQRTRRITKDGVEMSITEVSGDADDDTDAPPIVKALMNAFEGMVSDLEKASEEAKKSAQPEYHDFDSSHLTSGYRIGDMYHLEGLHLIGELEPARRALHALGMDFAGICADGVKDTGHVFKLRYTGSKEQAERVSDELVTQERYARIRLFEEMPRILGDSVCRALAILKNARLISPGELFDLLSPLRLAAQKKMLEGITLKEIDKLMLAADLSSSEDSLDCVERDDLDAQRADKANARFEDVLFNENL